jgi:hypothetical protein
VVNRDYNCFPVDEKLLSERSEDFVRTSVGGGGVNKSSECVCSEEDVSGGQEVFEDERLFRRLTCRSDRPEFHDLLSKLAQDLGS